MWTKSAISSNMISLMELVIHKWIIFIIYEIHYAFFVTKKQENSMTTLYVTAGLVLSSERPRQEVLAAMRQLTQATLTEPGCVSFEFLAHHADPSRFTLWERWDSEAALDAHYHKAHTRAYLSQGWTRIESLHKHYSLTSPEA
ncbi:antibiotic biosynthesis monooxygenase (plasmid) [Vibrio coralliilyticus]|nr:antibiotic biosynthesis monooxygenase [Vibrio coralliilyticus]